MTALKSKLSIQMVCNAQRVRALLPEGTDRQMVGTIMGKASDILVRSSPDGAREFRGLKGNFEAIPVDGSETLVSSICYLPDWVQPQIEALLFDMNTGERTNVPSVGFGFEIYLTRANNPQKYSWELVPMRAPAADDPLADLRAEFEARKALTHQPAAEQPAAQEAQAEPAPRRAGRR